MSEKIATYQDLLETLAEEFPTELEVVVPFIQAALPEGTTLESQITLEGLENIFSTLTQLKEQDEKELFNQVVEQLKENVEEKLNNYFFSLFKYPDLLLPQLDKAVEKGFVDTQAVTGSQLLSELIIASIAEYTIAVGVPSLIAKLTKIIENVKEREGASIEDQAGEQ